jgi:hypothetical protein
VDEDENPPPWRAPDARIEIHFSLGEIHAIGPKDNEVTLRIAWR